MVYQLFCRAAAGVGADLVQNFLLAHQEVLAVIHLQRIAQRARGARNDGDLLHGSAVRLQRGHERVADLVTGHNFFLLIGQHTRLFLVARDDHLDTLLQILLRGKFPPVAHGAQRSFVDDIRKLRTGGACGHLCDGCEVHVAGQPDVFGMHLQDIHAALQVGKFHGNAPVKAARTQQGRVERIGPVGRGQHDHAL